jgi:hypothetical protein
MKFVNEMANVINSVLSDRWLKIESKGVVNILTPNKFKSEVFLYAFHKRFMRTIKIDEYYEYVRIIFNNLEYIGSRLNVVFNLFAYDKLKPVIALGVGDDIMHDRDVLPVGTILHKIGFSRDIAIIDVIRGIGYNLVIIK